MKKKNSIRAGTLALATLLMSTSVYAQPTSFTDVQKTHWAYEHIIKLNRLHIVDGYEDGTFKPTRSVSYLEVIELLKGLMNPSKSEIESAVKKWHTVLELCEIPSWAQGAVAISLERDVLNEENLITAKNLGYMNTAPKERSFPTRELVMVLYAKTLGVSPISDENILSVNDENEIGKTPKSLVGDVDVAGLYKAMVRTGIFAAEGSDGSFRPSDPLKREQMAKITDLSYVYLQKPEPSPEAPPLIINPSPSRPGKKDDNKKPNEKPGQDDNEKPDEKPEEEVPVEETTGLPVRFDLRKLPDGKTAVTPIKNQFYDGACRSFAVLGALESHLAYTGQGTFDLSENHMENHHGFTYNNTNDPRTGRARNSDIGYLISGRGPILEEEDPYIPMKHDFNPAPYLSDEQKSQIEEANKNNLTQAQVNAQKDKPVNATPGKLVTGFEFLKSLDAKNITSPDDVQLGQIKGAIKEHGAVVTDIYMEHDGNKTFPYSNAKTYNPETYAYYSDEENVDANHAVTIVGWDDDFKKENFSEQSRPSIDGAWIVKDAQTDAFGDDGYFYVSFQSSAMGTNPYVFTKVEDRTNYKMIYQHDELPLSGFVQYNSFVFDVDKNIVFNRYVSNGEGTLDSVGFFTTKPGAGYEIYFLEDFDNYRKEFKWMEEEDILEKLEEDGKCILKGTMEKAGYHQMELPEELKKEIASGESFAVGYYVKNPDSEDPGHEWDMVVEMNKAKDPNGNLGKRASIEKNETYIIAQGTLADLKPLAPATEEGAEINGAIKVYTK